MNNEYHASAQKVVEDIKTAMSRYSRDISVDILGFNDSWSIRLHVDDLDAEYASLSVGVRCEAHLQDNFLHVLYPVVNFQGSTEGCLDVDPEKWKETASAINKNLEGLRSYLEGLGELGVYDEDPTIIDIPCRKIDLGTFRLNSE